MTVRIPGVVTLRRTSNGGIATGQLSVPSSMMQFLTLGDKFRPEFTEEGILYRPLKESDQPKPPVWVEES